MTKDFTRRDFLKTAAAAGTGAVAVGPEVLTGIATSAPVAGGLQVAMGALLPGGIPGISRAKFVLDFNNLFSKFQSLGEDALEHHAGRDIGYLVNNVSKFIGDLPNMVSHIQQMETISQAYKDRNEEGFDSIEEAQRISEYNSSITVLSNLNRDLIRQIAGAEGHPLSQAQANIQQAIDDITNYRDQQVKLIGLEGYHPAEYFHTFGNGVSYGGSGSHINQVNYPQILAQKVQSLLGPGDLGMLIGQWGTGREAAELLDQLSSELETAAAQLGTTLDKLSISYGLGEYSVKQMMDSAKRNYWSRHGVELLKSEEAQVPNGTMQEMYQFAEHWKKEKRQETEAWQQRQKQLLEEEKLDVSKFDAERVAVNASLALGRDPAAAFIFADVMHNVSVALSKQGKQYVLDNYDAQVAEGDLDNPQNQVRRGVASFQRGLHALVETSPDEANKRLRDGWKYIRDTISQFKGKRGDRFTGDLAKQAVCAAITNMYRETISTLIKENDKFFRKADRSDLLLDLGITLSR